MEFADTIFLLRLSVSRFTDSFFKGMSVSFFLPMWQLPRAVVGTMFALVTLLSVGKKKLG